MSVSRRIFTCLKADLTVKFHRRKLQTQTSTPQTQSHHETNCAQSSPSASSIHSFVKDFVKRNLKSVTNQIIKAEKNSNDDCKVEQGIQKAKHAKKKYPPRTGRKTERPQQTHQEISEESLNNRSTPKRQKAPRPNYFIAIQVTDAKVLERAKRIQESILENSSTDLRHMKVDVRKSHITLMAMHLADPLAVNCAKLSLDQCISAINSKQDLGTMTLEFEGLSVFSGGSVLFITVKQSSGLQALVSMADLIRKEMEQRGVMSAGKDFTPHVTLMKYRWKKQTQNRAKKVEKEAYKRFEKEPLGTQSIASVQLCRMEGVREDGYYIVEHEVLVNR